MSQGTGRRDQGPGDKDQGTGIGDQGSEDRTAEDVACLGCGCTCDKGEEQGAPLALSQDRRIWET